MIISSTEFAAGPGVWRVHSARPDAELAGIVEEFWAVEAELLPFTERVLPSGFVELMFNLGPVHRLVSEDGVQYCDHSWVAGLQERALTIESHSGTNLVSARLRAAHARRIIGPAVSRTGNRVIDLDSVIGGDARSVRDALLAAVTLEERMDELADFVRARVSASPPTDARVTTAVAAIDASHGGTRLEELSRRVGISRKHLGALFRAHLGVSPKAYSRIARFAWVLRRIQESETADWSSLAHEAGYSDQSHLVRDFQRVASASPGSFLRARTPDGAAMLVDGR